VIKPAISKRRVVIADRFDVSTFAYQVAGRQLPFGPVVAANEFAKDGLVPDLIFYLEIDFEVAKERLQKRGRKLDKIESSGGDFHRRVHDGYGKYIRLYPQSVRFHLPKSVTEKPPAVVHQYIMEELKRRFAF
jgi:dTMP kinase